MRYIIRFSLDTRAKSYSCDTYEVKGNRTYLYGRVAVNGVRLKHLKGRRYDRLGLPVISYRDGK